MMNKISDIVNFNNLSFNYNNTKALNKLGFSIRQQEIFGIVGPDGAGKSTAIKIMCGLLNPQEGSVSVFGMNMVQNKKKIQRRIGYLSQHFSLYGDLSVDENLDFFSGIHSFRHNKELKEKLLAFTRLEKFRKRRADQLSGGMKQKLALACTLIHKPDIIFLDEPTTGVDPVSRRDFWSILNSLRKEGLSIVMSTPYMDEAERCERVLMLNNGSELKCDSPINIRRSLKQQFIKILADDLRKIYDNSKNMQEIHSIQLFGDSIHIAYDPERTDMQKIKVNLKNKTGQNLKIYHINPTLEDAFINFISAAGE